MTEPTVVGDAPKRAGRTQVPRLYVVMAAAALAVALAIVSAAFLIRCSFVMSILYIVRTEVQALDYNYFTTADSDWQSQ